jgi:hypothetical protein
MPKLFMIGDSFFAPIQPHSHGIDKEEYHKFREMFRPVEWWNILGAKLGMECIINLSEAGTGLDWMCDRLVGELNSNINSGDIVLISLTHPDRKWAVEEAPYASNLACLQLESFRESLIKDIKDSGKLKDEVKFRVQMEAAYQYWLHCKSERLDTYNSFGLIYFMKEIMRRKNIKPVFISSVSNIGTAENIYINGFNTLGTLQDVAINEFKGKTFKDREIQRDSVFMRNTKWWNGRDQRIAHITFNNHKVLADKLYKSITNNAELDLKNGFDECIVDLNKEPELHLYCKENNWDYLQNKSIN